MHTNFPDQHAAALALDRLLWVARGSDPQSRWVAEFLVALHDGYDDADGHSIDLLNVEAQIADDMLTVLHMVRESPHNPHGLAFRDELSDAWRILRGNDTR